MAKKSDKKKEEVKPEPEVTVSVTEIVDFEKIKATVMPAPEYVQTPPKVGYLGERVKQERQERKGK